MAATSGAGSIVLHHPHLHRFDLVVDGRPASWLEYEPVVHASGTVWRITHTVTVPALRGRGLAGALVAHVVGDAAVQGVGVDPRCPFVREWFLRHPEHAGVVVAG